MANITELNKLFVRVPSNSGTTLETVVTTSGANPKKIYFVEASNTIVNNGVKYGIDPTTAQSLQDLIAVVGQSELGQSGVDASTVVQRLAKLEAINVNAASANYLNVSDGTGGDAPEIGVKIVGIEENTQGLVDAVNAKQYIDASILRATTQVDVTKGLTMTKTADAHDASVYTITPDLKIAYNAATSGDNAQPATIQLRSTDNASVFGTINVSDIIGNGVLSSTVYNPSTGILTLTFANAGGTPTTVDVDLHEMLDINDMSIANDSSNYLEVTLTPSAAEDGKSQAVFGAKIADVSTAANGSTGLVDAWDVKQYIASQTTDLQVEAAGDTNYIDASQDGTNNKKINVAAKLATITGNAGAVSQETVSDAGAISGKGATAATLSADETNGSLLDATDTVTAVTTYVGGAIAIEAKARELAIEAAIKGLDSTANDTGTNVSVDVSLVDGKIAEITVGETYATVTGTRSAQDTPAAVSITTPEGLVTGNDLSTLINYTNDRIDEELADMEVTANGDTSYIDATGDGHNVSVAAKLGTVSVTTTAGQDTAIAGTTGLVDASVMAANVSTFVNTRITEEIAKLDSSITESDSANYVTVTTAIADGALDAGVSAVAVQYGSFETANASLGIAKTNEVINYVDTYDFWENYPTA